MKDFQLEWQATKESEGRLLREFLFEQSVSKAALTDIKFNGGLIAVNGKEVTVRHLLREGDRVLVRFPQEQPSEGLAPEQLPLDIVYEDDYVLVINKAPYMNTIPSREHPAGSVANAVLGHYKKTGINSTFHVVTRLDRDTSGLLLIAKHRHIHYLLSEQQKQRRIKRTYEALVYGSVSGDGVIEEPIGRKTTSIIEREVRSDGQYALTSYASLGGFGRFSHVELNLGTGRTHQIRVHMSYIGHPLLGDSLYGGSRDDIGRQALHCKRLEFYHPISGERIVFRKAMPEDMKKLLEADV